MKALLITVSIVAYLLLWISFLYSLIFYSLGRTIETIIFFVVWMLFFVYFFSIKITHQKEEKGETIVHISIRALWNFLDRFSFYFGSILFYLSLYFLWRYFSIHFSYIIFGVSFFITSSFFLSHKSSFVYDLFKTNTNLFSLIYMILYSYIIIENNNFFMLIDFINSISIIAAFVVLMYYNKAKNKKLDSVVLVYFFVYLFAVLLFYAYIYILQRNLLYWLSFLSLGYWWILFLWLPSVKLFQKKSYLLRLIWILFIYLGNVLSIIYLVTYWFNYSLCALLLLSIGFNYYTHTLYRNYISFLLSVFTLIFLIYYFLIHFGIITSYKSLAVLITSIIISIALVTCTYIIKLKLKYDYYLIHCLSYTINIISTLLYLLTNPFNSVTIWVIFLIDSIYFYLSYFKLKQFNTKTQKWKI